MHHENSLIMIIIVHCNKIIDRNIEIPYWSCNIIYNYNSNKEFQFEQIFFQLTTFPSFETMESLLK